MRSSSARNGGECVQLQGSCFSLVGQLRSGQVYNGLGTRGCFHIYIKPCHRANNQPFLTHRRNNLYVSPSIAAEALALCPPS